MTKENKMIEDIDDREYILTGEKTYCLYDDKNQTELIAMAYSLEQLKDVTKYYSSGVWFEYDNTLDNNMLLNERKYAKRVVFPKEPLELKSFNETAKEDKFKLNSKMGDVR